MVKLLPRQTIAVLSLTGITVCKLAVFLLLLKAGYAQPYVGGGAHSVFLPAANKILTTGTFNDPDTSSWSKVAPGYAVFLATGYHLFVRFYEEPTLRRKFGEEYIQYCALVSRWLPHRSTFSTRKK